MPKSIILLFSHPAQSHSKINRPLFEIAQAHPNVTTVDVYHEYPDSHINLRKHS